MIKKKLKSKYILPQVFKFNLTEILDNPITTIGNGKYMLIEFQRLHFREGYENEIFKLQMQGIAPIIAHPERYRILQKDYEVAKKWIDRGYIIQIDCASILGKFGSDAKNCAINLLENNLCHLVGSDAHNDKNRNFLLKETHSKIVEFLSENVSNTLKLNSQRVLNGQDCLTYNHNKQKKSIFKRFFNLNKR